MLFFIKTNSKEHLIFVSGISGLLFFFTSLMILLMKLLTDISVIGLKNGENHKDNVNF
jgi:hypothetical protein